MLHTCQGDFERGFEGWNLVFKAAKIGVFAATNDSLLASYTNHGGWGRLSDWVLIQIWKNQSGICEFDKYLIVFDKFRIFVDGF